MFTLFVDTCIALDIDIWLDDGEVSTQPLFADDKHANPIIDVKS